MKYFSTHNDHKIYKRTDTECFVYDKNQSKWLHLVFFDRGFTYDDLMHFMPEDHIKQLSTEEVFLEIL